MPALRIRAVEGQAGLELAVAPVGASAARPVWVPAFLIVLGLVIVSTGLALHTPAITGAGTLFFVLALALVLSRRRSPAWVRLDRERVRARCGAESLDVSRDAVEDVGTGEDGATRTLWLQVRGQGRLLALEGLDPADAARAAEALREALAAGPEPARATHLAD